MSTSRDIDGLADTQVAGEGASQPPLEAGSTAARSASASRASASGSSALSDDANGASSNDVHGLTPPRHERQVRRAPDRDDAAADDDARDSAVPADAELPYRIGSGCRRQLPVEDDARYEMLCEYARGGLGRVMKARDERLGRTVAIKELLRVSDFAESLFVREALITARLQHPGIVPVHEAGRWPSGAPFYVMKLVSGKSLLQRLRGTTTLKERLAYLPNVIAVVETIAYAHSEGILHRDIKSANIIVGEFGETVVVDWGLARDDKQHVPFASDLAEMELATQASSDGGSPTVWLQIGNYSVSGKVVGTPAYMAPEQARGQGVSDKADIYSLGALLYEVLTGHPPYPGKDPQVVLEKVLSGPPACLLESDRTIPCDLVTIVEKAMAREPEDRYAGAKDLAEDLKRFQTGMLVSAHEYSAWFLLRRWLWRHRSPVMVGAAAVVLLAVMAAVSMTRVVEAKNQAEADRQVATEKKQKALWLKARESLAHDPTASVAWLKQIPLEGEWLDRARDVFSAAMARGVARHVIAHGGRVMSATFTPDGRHVISTSLDGTVRLIRVDNGTDCIIEQDEMMKFDQVAVSSMAPDGAWIAAGAITGEIRLLRVDSDFEVIERRTLEGHVSRHTALDFIGDGRLTSVSRDLTARVWDLTTGAELAVFETVDDAVFSPDGDRIALSPDGDGVVVIDVRTRSRSAAIPILGRGKRMAFSPDGLQLAVSDGSELHLVELSSHRITGLGKPGMTWFAGLRFSPSGRWLATPGQESTILAWDLHARPESDGTRSPTILRGHETALFSIAFSPDETTLISASDDNTARLWDLESDHSRVLRGHDDDVAIAAFDPGGDVVVTGSLDGTVRIWPARADSSRRLRGVGDVPRVVRYDSDRILTVLYKSGEVQRLDLDRQNPPASVAPRDAPEDSTSLGEFVALSPDRRHVLSTNWREYTWALWDLVDGPTKQFEKDGEKLLGGAFARDRAMAAMATSTGTVTLWQPGRETVALRRDQIVCGLALSPDGSRLVITTARDAELIDVASRATIARHPLPRVEPGCGQVFPSRTVVYGPRQDWIAISGLTRDLWIWRLAPRGGPGNGPGDGTLVELDTERHNIINMIASPDGSLLAMLLEEDRSVRLWDPLSNEIRSLGRHDDLPRQMAFSPDGSYLATTGTDAVIRLWHRPSNTTRVLRGHGKNVLSLAFSADSSELASGSHDRTVRVWSLEPESIIDGRALGAMLEERTTTTVGDHTRWRARTLRAASDDRSGIACKDRGPLARGDGPKSKRGRALQFP